MRVALVTPGGVDPAAEERSFPYLLALIERLARNHDVLVFSLHQGTQPSTYTLAGATVHDAGVPPGAGRRRAYLRTARSMIAQHRRAPFDLLHAFWLVPPGLIAVAVGQLIRRPVVVHVAGGELVALPDIAYGWQLSWRTRIWTRLALAGARAVTAATMPMVDLVKQHGKRAERVPFGVDLHQWPPLPPRPRQAGAPVRIVHVASLNLVKDQTTLLHAAAELVKSVPVELDIAGIDTMNGRIQALAADLGLSGRVRFHGHLRHQELRPLVEKADLFWLTSRHEAGPVAVLEAAVAGVPTVGTAVGHVGDWASDAAVAVPVRDAQALARETAALLADEPRRMRIAAEAQRRAIAEDADWMARQVEVIYQELA